jgi:hypothetical protein
MVDDEMMRLAEAAKIAAKKQRKNEYFWVTYAHMKA